MNQEGQGASNPASKGAWIRSFSPQRPNARSSGSPDGDDTRQANAAIANIPESEPKMVTLLRVSPCPASVSSRRQSRSKPVKAALQEKKSQYLEYASQVEERRRQSNAMQGGRSGNVSRTRGGPGKEQVQSNPLLAHRPLSEVRQSRQAPPKPKRNFSVSPPHPMTRETNRLPNGQPHLGPKMVQNHRSENHTHHAVDRDAHRNSSLQREAEHQIASNQTSDKAAVAKRRPKGLYPLPEPYNQPKVPQAPPRTSQSTNRASHQPPAQLKIRAEVHRAPPSKDGSSPRHPLPVGSLPSEESVLSWFNKMEAQDPVSNPYPPAGRSQSADPRSRLSASKAELRQDLKSFDEMSLAGRQRVRSPDSRYDGSQPHVRPQSSTLPVPRERQSRVDEFEKANRITKVPSHTSLSQHQATPSSRIPVRKGAVDHPRGDTLKNQDAKPRTSSSNPEPPPRQRKTLKQGQTRLTKASPDAKSEIPSRRTKEVQLKSTPHQLHQNRRDNEPQAPPRPRKGSRETPGQISPRKPEENKSPPSERNGKALVSPRMSSVQTERPSSRHSVKAPEKTAKSPTERLTTDNTLEGAPKRPKSTSPMNQELRRRLSEILMERRNSENRLSNARTKRKPSPSKQGTSSEGESRVQSPEVSKQDVVDMMLDSTLQQDFKGELDRNLARRKIKLEQSFENREKKTPKGKNQEAQPRTEVSTMVDINPDSGLGASLDSQTNPVKGKTTTKNVLEGVSSKLDGNQNSLELSEIIVSEWSDEIESVPPKTEEPMQAFQTKIPSDDQPLNQSVILKCPQPSSHTETSDEVQKKDKIPQDKVKSKEEIPHKEVTEEITPHERAKRKEDVANDEVKRKVRLRRWSIASDGERLRVPPRPLSKSYEDKRDGTQTSILSSMKVGISVPDMSRTTSDDVLDDRQSLLEDSDGLLNVKEIEKEIERASSANTSSVQSIPHRSTPSQGSTTPEASSLNATFQDSEEGSQTSVPSSPRRTTPPHERLIQSAASPPVRPLERSHQSLRQLPVKVLPTSPQGTDDLTPTFSEDHDMSRMSLGRPTTPSQPSTSPSDMNLKKPRYLKLTGMQLLPQKLQLLSSKDKSKGTPQDEPDRTKQGLYKKSEYRGRERSKKDSAFSPVPKVKKRSASADGFFSLQRERSPSPLGLRGFGSPSRQGKVKDKRGRHKMLTPPSNHALKMPRQPRPQRMHTILESLKKGLKDTIDISKEKLTVMEQHQHDPKTTSSRQGFHYNLDKQIKVAERYIRKLQFHLAKVEEVHEQYDKELKVREGAVNVVKAYADTNLPHGKDPSSEAKASVRDCTQSLCQMEAELEANLGAFVVRIDGIAGFARVCRGDVFEVVFKYGLQKWKSRCKVEKDLSQSWDVDEIVMYPMLADFLTIKVTEMRGITRSNMVIGNLEFDTSDFYQADPQTLTIDVNENGTIKLNLVVTWSPFHINEEMYKSPKNSYSRRERAFTESVIGTSKTFNSNDKDPASLPKKYTPQTLDLNTSPTLTLEEAMHNFTRLLEILKGQYVELEGLEKQVGHLNDLLKRIRERKKRDSSMSLLVKNALDSFDFLNDMEDEHMSIIDSGSSSMDENRSSIISDDFCKSQSSDRLSDCASLEEPLPDRRDSAPSSFCPGPIPHPQNLPLTRANRGSRIINMSEKRESRLIEMNEQRERRLVDSPLGEPLGRCWEEGTEGAPKLTTGSDSIDQVLVQHLMYIEFLLSHLGAFGPLKLKETIALKKLKKQAVIIEQLLVLSVSNSPVSRADDVFPELKLNPTLLDFWQHCAEKEALYINAESFLLQLDVKFGAKLRTSHPDIADDVFQSLCNRIIERPVDLYHPKTIITLFQYISFFATDDRRYPEKFIHDLTKDFELTASLEPSNPDLSKVMKKLPKGSLLSTGNLRALGLLLLEDRATIQTGVRVYLESIGGNDKLRKKAINVYLECLEERDLSLRQAGCAAIAAMKATEALEQLLYLLKCDMDDVKSTAKEALMAFGEEGRQAYEQISYTPYGNYNHDYSEVDVPLMTTEL